MFEGGASPFTPIFLNALVVIVRGEEEIPNNKNKIYIKYFKTLLAREETEKDEELTKNYRLYESLINLGRECAYENGEYDNNSEVEPYLFSRNKMLEILNKYHINDGAFDVNRALDLSCELGILKCDLVDDIPKFGFANSDYQTAFMYLAMKEDNY